MAVQTRSDNSTVPLIKSGASYVKSGTIGQNQRATDLLHGTVLGRVAATGVYGPYNSLTDITGLSTPQAIYLGDDILAADIVAGDIEDVPILIGGCCTVDENLVIFDDDTLSPDSVVSAAAANPYIVMTARECLSMFGIFLEDTENISDYEN